MNAIIFAISIILGYVGYYLYKSVKRPANFPPGPDFIPFVGNTIQLRKEAVAAGGQHKAFENWSKRYNSNILGFKLGRELVVIARSYPLVKEINLLEVFEGRPDNFFLRLRTMGTRKGITCTDGHLWYEHRHFAMKQMRHIGYGRTPMEQHIEKETASLLQFIEEFKGQPVRPGSFLAQSVINVLWSMTAGKLFQRDDKRLVKLLDLLDRRTKIFDIAGGVLSQFPWLRFVAPNKTGYNLIKQFNNELFQYLKETIDEHKASLTKENADNDLIYAYINEMQQETNKDNENSTFNETQLTMTILDFFIAGSQTTSTNMDLALMTLAMRSDIQKLIYDEIVANIKNTEFPHLSSKLFYPYMDAFIMEVQRFYHMAPISGPRRALWDTKLDGYDIPKNTTILTSLYSVLMDADHWQDPHNFRPERFIDDEGKTIKDEYFIPFGLGRRRCLGDAMARACIFSVLVKICQTFELVLSDKEEDKPSLDLFPGITLSTKSYKIKFIKRQW